MNAPRSYPNPAITGLPFAADISSPNPYYWGWREFLRVWMCAMWRVRVFNRHFEPTSGGVIYVSNHQSFLDPVLISIALRRQMNYMARDSLFKIPGFRQLIMSVNTFPVKRGKADLSALKESMRRLKTGVQLAIFAEGTRTRDGRIGEFLPGVAILAQRAAEWTVPVLIDGAFEAWPRTQILPSLGTNIVVQYGRPIHCSEARKMKSKGFVSEVRRRLIIIQADVRRRAGRPQFTY